MIVTTVVVALIISAVACGAAARTVRQVEQGRTKDIQGVMAPRSIRAAGESRENNQIKDKGGVSV